MSEVGASRGIRGWCQEVASCWDAFWFTPRQPHTLAAIRVLGGWMLLYTHLVWALDLMSFLGPHSWIPPDVARQTSQGPFVWSHLWYTSSPALLWLMHGLALLVFLLLMLGLATRYVSIAAWLLAVSYCHRLNGALFGLDQVNVMLSMYLMVGRCGDVYSLDAWLRRRRADQAPLAPAVSTNLAIRLLQLHLCIIYLFGGIGKLRGQSWWIGDAFWFSIANYEYQSFDMTWLVHYPWLMSLASHVTVFWETFYCALVWPRLTRPIVLLLAVFVHGGIILFLGMPTFGSAMLIANLAFVSSESIERLRAAMLRWFSRAP